MGILIFFDTGGWAALSIPGDLNAPAARRLFSEVSRGRHGAVVTTSFVLDEVVTLLRAATDVETASRFARGILGSRETTIVWIDQPLFEAALEEFESHADKRWSLTDCSSFVVMRQLGLDTAFSFDKNFEQTGFLRLP